MIQSVSHPNIIALEDLIQTPENLYFVLELAEGGELKKMIGKVERRKASRLCHFMFYICNFH